MTAKRKQKFLITLSIFLALCSIGSSFNKTAFFWFWQKYPIIPILLLMFVFFAIRYWLKLEVERQRQHIRSVYEQNVKNKEQNNFKNLLSKRELEVLDLINNGLSNQENSGRIVYSAIYSKNTY